MTPVEHDPRPGHNRVLGASYLSAVLHDDRDMVAAYRDAYDAGELLDALSSQLVVMGNRIATTSNRTPGEVGDDMVAAATGIQRMHDSSINPSDNTED